MVSNEVVNLHVLTLLVGQPDNTLEEVSYPFLGDSHVERVETRNLFGLDETTEMPIRCHRHCDRL